MKSFELVVVLIGFVGLVAGQSTNYCSQKLCGGAKHIACNNTGAFGSNCPADRQIVTMTQEIKDAILKKHNDLRNALGSGPVANLSVATSMRTLTWDNELASLAELNVKTCIAAYDACHNTETYPNSGQNIAKMSTNGPFTTGSAVNAGILIDALAAQEKTAKMSDIKSFPSSQSIANFGLIAIDYNTVIGCGIATFKAGETNNFLMACNYGANNIINGQTYASCVSGCKTGSNPDLSGLCSKNEQY